MWLNAYLYIAVMCLAALITLSLAIYGVQQRATPAAPAFAWLMATAFAWISINLLGLLSPTVATTLFWHKAGYLVVATIPLAWIAFVLTYTHREKWLTVRRMLALAVIPLAMVIMVWTNDAHLLFWSSYASGPEAGLMRSAVTFGPGGLISIFYAQGVLIAGAGWVGVTFYRSSGLYRRQTAWVLAGVFVPLLANIVYVARLLPIQDDLTTVSFAATGLLLAAGVFRTHLLDLPPIARDKVIESMADAVIVLDQQNRIVDLNPAAQRLMGQTAAQAVGQSAEEYFRPWPHLVERYRSRPEAQDEIVISDREADYVYDLRLSPLVDRRGRMTGRLLVLRDITERKQAEEALQKSEQKFHGIVEHSADGVVLADEQGHIIEWNRGLEQITGIARAEVLGQLAAAIQTRLTLDLPPEKLALASASVFQTGEFPWEVMRLERTIRRADQACRLIEETPFILQTEKGFMVGSILHDITERQQAEDEIRRLNTHLEDQVRERTRQLSAANERLQALPRQLVEVQENERRQLALELHDELGQLLNSAKMSLDMMANLPPPAAQQQFQRAQTLIRDLIRRVRELALDLRPAMLDDLGLVAALTSLCRRQAAQTGIHASFQNALPEATRFPSPVETAVYRIAQEGLTNAARHAGVGEVTLALNADQNQLTLEITDTGTGFVPAEALTARTSTGLSGMRERARLLGGELVIASAPGGGTRLLASLPLPQSGPGPARP